MDIIDTKDLIDIMDLIDNMDLIDKDVQSQLLSICIQFSKNQIKISKSGLRGPKDTLK